MTESAPTTPGLAALLRELLRCYRPYWGRALLLLPLLLFQGVFYLCVPLSFKVLFDDAIGGRDADVLLRVVIALGIGFLLVTGAEMLQAWLAARLGTRVANDLRRGLFTHLQHLSMAFYDRSRTGDLVSRFTNDLQAVERAVAVSVYVVALHLIIATLSVAFLFVLDWRLALATLAAMPLAAVGPRLLGGWASRAVLARREQDALVVHTVQESLAAYKVVRAFGLERHMLDRFANLLARLQELATRANVAGALVEKSSSLSVVFVQLLVVAVGAWLAIEGYMSGGAVIGFVGLLVNVGDSIGRMTSTVPDVIQSAGAMARIRQILDERPDMVDADQALPLSSVDHEIRFDGVGFGYDEGQRNLSDLDLVINAGQSVVVVGRSGSGKSTVINLLTRFYDTSEGSISIDGHELRRIARDALRARIGCVFQDTYLFDTTLRENIRLGRDGATDEEVLTAARDAELHDFVTSLPEGYDTPVGEGGGRLSGGQRQRIALARALLRDPDILVLDEATSALDPATEAAINATLERIAGQRTIVSVTHRLSAAANADRIFVLDQGRLVESGNHRELLNRKGPYFEMWREFSFELTQQALVGDVDQEIPLETPEPPVAGALDGDGALQRQLAAQQAEIVRLQRINQRWAQMAGTDRLTGLPDRVSFLQVIAPQELQQAQRQGAAVGFILASGDNLGLVNERHGRDAGNAILRELGRLLSESLRGEERLAHIDGVHFVILLQEADLQATRFYAEALRSQVEARPFRCGTERIRLTLSLGVTTVSLDPDSDHDPQALVEEALDRLDEAVYRAKRDGGNRIAVAESEADAS